MFNSTDIIKSQLPAIAVRGVIPLPNNEIRIDVGRLDSLKALKEAEQFQNYNILLVQENPTIENQPLRMLKGLLWWRIALNMTMPNNIRKVKLQSIVRCKIDGSRNSSLCG